MKSLLHGQIVSNRRTIVFLAEEMDASMTMAEKVLGDLRILESLWCKAIACVEEQIYIPELAYELDYVFKNSGGLSKPAYSSEYSLFPNNYENFNYTEGIADYFENIMGTVF